MKAQSVAKDFPVVCVGGSAGGLDAYITIAQKLDTAGQPDMPESALASGCIDFILSPENIAREIVRIAQAAAKAA